MGSAQNTPQPHGVVIVCVTIATIITHVTIITLTTTKFAACDLIVTPAETRLMHVVTARALEQARPLTGAQAATPPARTQWK